PPSLHDALPISPLLAPLEVVMQFPGDGYSFASEANRRRDQVRPLELAVLLMRQRQAGDGTRNANGQDAFVVRIVPDPAVFAEVHILGRCQRRFLPEIESGRFPVGAVVDEETAA